MPDSTPSFMMFGGGDGFGFTPYSEKKIDSSARLFGGKYFLFITDIAVIQ